MRRDNKRDQTTVISLFICCYAYMNPESFLYSPSQVEYLWDIIFSIWIHHLGIKVFLYILLETRARLFNIPFMKKPSTRGARKNIFPKFTDILLKRISSEAAHQGYSNKNMLWKHAANLQENTNTEVWFQLYWNHNTAWLFSCKFAAYL